MILGLYMGCLKVLGLQEVVKDFVVEWLPG